MSFTHSLPPTPMLADKSVYWPTTRVGNATVYSRPECPSEIKDAVVHAGTTRPSNEYLHESGGFSHVYAMQTGELLTAIKRAYWLGQRPDLHHGLSALRANLSVQHGLARLREENQNTLYAPDVETRFYFGAPDYHALYVPDKPEVPYRMPCLAMSFETGQEANESCNLPPMQTIIDLLNKACSRTGIHPAYLVHDLTEGSSSSSPHWRNLLIRNPTISSKELGRVVIKVDSYAKKPIKFKP